MGRKKKKKQQRIPRPSFKVACKSWYSSKAPMLLFCAKFGGLMVSFHFLSFTSTFKRILDVLVAANAKFSSVILNFFGESSRVTGATIWSGKDAIITVLPACTCIEFFLFFIAAVLAFPALIRRKIPGIVVGVALLMGLNLIRVMSLYYIGVHFPRFFDTAHEEVWGIPLIIATVFICAVWIEWAQRGNQKYNVAT
jgi:exosortase/archaeosortase family protein